MIGKQNKDINFFDSYVFGNLLPEKHILLDINRKDGDYKRLKFK